MSLVNQVMFAAAIFTVTSFAHADAGRFETIANRNITHSHPRILGLDGYDSEDKIIYSSVTRDGCQFTLGPVNDFAPKDGYLIPDQEMRLQVGEFKSGRTIADLTECKDLPFMYRRECERKNRDSAGLNPYTSPNSVAMKSADGRILTVYFMKDQREGAMRCLRNHAFNLPPLDSTRDPSLQTAISGASAGR